MAAGLDGMDQQNSLLKKGKHCGAEDVFIDKTGRL